MTLLLWTLLSLLVVFRPLAHKVFHRSVEVLCSQELWKHFTQWVVVVHLLSPSSPELPGVRTHAPRALGFLGLFWGLLGLLRLLGLLGLLGFRGFGVSGLPFPVGSPSKQRSPLCTLERSPLQPMPGAHAMRWQRTRVHATRPLLRDAWE